MTSMGDLCYPQNHTLTPCSSGSNSANPVDVLEVLVAATLAFSIVCVLVMCVSFARNSKLRRHPNKMIVSRCVFDGIFCVAYVPACAAAPSGISQRPGMMIGN